MSPHANFVHLHVHTQYSMLDGACKVKELVKIAEKMKFPAIAITDHGNMFGAIDFYLAAQSAGIKPIIGTEVYVAPRSRFDKTAHSGDVTAFHLVLLAKDLEGYQNIMKLSSIGFLEGFYYKPRVDKAVLREHSKGVIAMSACLQGEIAYYAAHDQEEQAEEALQEYLDIYGAEDFYVEIQDHGIPEQKKSNKVLIRLAKEYGLKLVATNDLHYLKKKDALAHEALLCIQTGTTLDDPKRMRFSTQEFYLKSEDEMRALFPEYPEACDNTIEIMDKCNLELNLGENLLPYFEVPDNKDHAEYVRELCIEGLKRKLEGGVIPDEYMERLDYELSVIIQMGYVDYFLITWDFCNYAKENGIAVGPGRGSAAGSLVSYALSITEVDPIPFNLIFERFLNPERVSMPDVDIDFCQQRREEAIRYVEQKYGHECVSQIITFSTLAARGVIRDVGRVMAIPLPEVDKIAKLIPDELGITLPKALEMEPQLKELANNDSQIAQLLETAQALEGLNRHAGIHAAGVVISDRPLSEYVPLYKQKDKGVTTQYPMKMLEKTGLLKMDFLGLKTLTFIDEALRIIKETENIDIDISRISFKDEKTYDLLCKGETFGVFQFESSGMRDMLRKAKPQVFEDVAALLALYRPGPLGSGMVDDFINRKNHGAEIKYDHPLLEPILKETYGVILYQEQVMKIVSALAGFSLAQADLLRRAIGKKIPEVLAEQKKHFVEGASKNGVDEKVAAHIFELIEYFAGYGFNKSHSVAYSFISYQTAFLKANYPLEFMTALLSIEKDNTDKVVSYIDEAKRLGFEIQPPCVNESFTRFTCSKEKKTIRFGLSAVKNVGTNAINSVVAVRNDSGPFSSIYDFTERVDSRLVNRKVMESLIKAGAFDCFGYKRSQLMGCLDHAIDLGSKLQKDKDRGQMSFFSDFQDGDDSFEENMQQIPEIEEWPESELLANEKAVLGFYISSHPLAKYERLLKNYVRCTSKSLPDYPNQGTVSVGGMLESVARKTTKRGDAMAIASLQDLSGKCTLVIFPKAYAKLQSILIPDSIVYVKGKNDSSEDEGKILVDEVFPLEDVRNKMTKVFSVDMRTAGLDKATLNQLRDLFLRYPGKIPVHINMQEPNGRITQIIAGHDFCVRPGEGLFAEVEELIGADAVKIIT